MSVAASDCRVVMHDDVPQYITTLAVLNGYWAVDRRDSMQSLEFLLHCFGNARPQAHTPAPHRCVRCKLFREQTRKLGTRNVCIPCFNEIVTAWQAGKGKVTL